eukprot:scaffold50756_cov46-Attheya_sp.AAC.3
MRWFGRKVPEPSSIMAEDAVGSYWLEQLLVCVVLGLVALWAMESRENRARMKTRVIETCDDALQWACDLWPWGRGASEQEQVRVVSSPPPSPTKIGRVNGMRHCATEPSLRTIHSSNDDNSNNKIPSNNEQDVNHSEASNNQSTRSILTGMVLPSSPSSLWWSWHNHFGVWLDRRRARRLHREKEETEQDAFPAAWPHIRQSPYRHLVLPPDCRFVPVHNTDASLAKQGKPSTTRVVVAGARWCIDMLKNLSTAKEFFVTLFTWLLKFFRKKQEEEDEVEVEVEEKEDEKEKDQEDEEQNEEQEKIPQKRAVKPSIDISSEAIITATADVGESSTSDENAPPPRPQHHHMEFDMGIEQNRTCSLGSLDDIVPSNSQLGGADARSNSPVPFLVDSAKVFTPPSSPRLLPIQRSGNKRKDKLEVYRSTRTMGLLPVTGPTPFVTGSSTSVVTIPRFLPPQEAVEKHHQRDSSESGSQMNFFDAANSNDSLKKLSRDVPITDKNGYILGDEFLRDSRCTPLLVFVNSRSGPQQGQVLITQLRRLLNPIQVWDLADGGPGKVIESFSVLNRLRILVCGGDGTVSWIISELEKNKALKRWPPIAILPLGTGNDLARVHGWGGGYNNESLLQILEQLSEAYVSLLDRWELSIVDSSTGKVKTVKNFTNYLGVGVDAQAALQVHMLRENRPKLFFSRVVNKAWYAMSGAEESIKASCAGLPNQIILKVDGVEVPLPPDSQGIVFLNIDSYSGGMAMWSQGMRPRKNMERRFSEGDFLAMERAGSNPSSPARGLGMIRYDSAEDLELEELYGSSLDLTDEEKLAKATACNRPSSCQDGMLDVVSIRGAFHLGQIRVGLSQAQLLCQCHEATVTLKKNTAVQIDGEPWRQKGSCTLQINRKKDPAIMLHRSPDEGGGVETEMANLLDWAEDRNIIDHNVHAT